MKITLSKSQWQMIGKKTGWMKKSQVDEDPRQTKFDFMNEPEDRKSIEKKVRDFLNQRYEKSSIPPNKQQFENEVGDIVDECISLEGGFESWLENFNENRKFNENR